jgi:hypothetical protein
MDILDLERKLGIDRMSADEQMALIVALQKSAEEKVTQAREETIGKSADLVIQGLKRIKSDIETRFSELNSTIQTKASSLKNGIDGKDGRDGKDGKSGRDGSKGDKGDAGRDGRDGMDGLDGVSVTAANIDFDGSLIITLSTGVELNVGEVVAPDLAERIKVITNGGGTSQSVLDTLTSLQAQITAMAGFVNYEGTWNASTNTPTLVSSVGTKGDYYVVSTTGTTNLNGITTWTQGDWAIFNGSVWEKVDNTDLVTSVAGRTGAITLTTADISGLGTIATQASSNVSITGGLITGITDLAIADGGTGASTAPDARTNLGLVIGTDVLAPTGSAANLTSFPTFNQNTTGTAASTPKLLTANFTVEESGGKLLFKYGATTIASMSSTGIITSATNIVANGTP